MGKGVVYVRKRRGIFGGLAVSFFFGCPAQPAGASTSREDGCLSSSFRAYELLLLLLLQCLVVCMMHRTFFVLLRILGFIF